MPISATSYLRHMLVEVTYLVNEVAKIDQQHFLQDETLKRAFVRSIEIIGEAAKQVPEETRSQAPEIEWRSIGRMRDQLIHNYMGIDYEIVWDVVSSKCAILGEQLTRLPRTIEEP